MGLLGKLLNSAVQGIDNLAKSLSEHNEYRYYLGQQEFLTSCLLVKVVCNENGQQKTETAMMTGATLPTTLSSGFSEKKMLMDWFSENAPETASRITEIVSYTNGVMVCPKCHCAEYKRGSEEKTFAKRRFVNGEQKPFSVKKTVTNSDGSKRQVTQEYNELRVDALPLMCSECGTKYVEDTTIKFHNGTYDESKADQIVKVIVYQQFDVSGITYDVDEHYLYHVCALKGIRSDGEEVDLMERVDAEEIFKENDAFDGDYKDEFYHYGKEETIPLRTIDDLIAKLFHPMPLIETVNQTEADEEARAIEENEDVEWM